MDILTEAVRWLVIIFALVNATWAVPGIVHSFKGQSTARVANQIAICLILLGIFGRQFDFMDIGNAALAAGLFMLAVAHASRIRERRIIENNQDIGWLS